MKLQLSTLTAAALFLGACGSESAEQAAAPAQPENDGPPVVAVSNYPLLYIAERIAGDAATVTFPIETDGDPAFWTPNRDVLKQFQEADLILFNGASYEKWVPTVSLPANRVVETAAGFEDQWITIENAVSHSHGDGEEHSHAGTDFNTWLDPQLAIQQADAVREALAELIPDQADQFEENHKALAQELAQLDERFAAIAEGHEETPIVASHPVYNYFARRYSLNLESMMWEPELMPDEEQWKHFADTLNSHPAKFMVWEGEPGPEIAGVLSEEYGVTPVLFDPAGNTPEGGDYLKTMKANADRLEAALSGEPN